MVPPIKVYFTLFLFKKLLRAKEMNWGPLSVTISSGKPYDATMSVVFHMSLQLLYYLS